MPEAFGPEAFRRATQVSADVVAKLATYAALLAKWQRAINLVGPGTLADVWRRHMFDSAQLFPLMPPQAHTLVDLGSGAGFPGLVLAIMGVPDVHLVESDHRKAAFLSHVSRETGAGATVHAERIEAMAPMKADVVTARALAPMPKLLGLARGFIGPQTVCLFLKGQDIVSELTKTPISMNMSVERLPSRTATSASILRLKEITYDG